MPKEKKSGRLTRYLEDYQGSQEPLLRSFSAVPYIELSANTQVLVDGCTNILEYGENCIRLAAGRFHVQLSGSGLCIRSMQEQCALITGVITAVEYLSAEG